MQQHVQRLIKSHDINIQHRHACYPIFHSLDCCCCAAAANADDNADRGTAGTGTGSRPGPLPRSMMKDVGCGYVDGQCTMLM